MRLDKVTEHVVATATDDDGNQLSETELRSNSEQPEDRVEKTTADFLLKALLKSTEKNF